MRGEEGRWEGGGKWGNEGGGEDEGERHGEKRLTTPGALQTLNLPEGRANTSPAAELGGSATQRPKK